MSFDHSRRRVGSFKSLLAASSRGNPDGVREPAPSLQRETPVGRGRISFESALGKREGSLFLKEKGETGEGGKLDILMKETCSEDSTH